MHLFIRHSMHLQRNIHDVACYQSLLSVIQSSCQKMLLMPPTTSWQSGLVSLDGPGLHNCPVLVDFSPKATPVHDCNNRNQRYKSGYECQDHPRRVRARYLAHRGLSFDTMTGQNSRSTPIAMMALMHNLRKSIPHLAPNSADMIIKCEVRTPLQGAMVRSPWHLGIKSWHSDPKKVWIRGRGI